jgi:hypothetical protein
MSDEVERVAALERAANAARERVQDALKETVERDLLGPEGMAPPRFTRVDTVVSDVMDPDQLENGDAGLASIGDIDDEERFRSFADQLTQLERVPS